MLCCRLCEARRNEEPRGSDDIAQQRRVASNYAWPGPKDRNLFAQGYQDDWFSYMVLDAKSREDLSAVAERKEIVAHYKIATKVCVSCQDLIHPPCCRNFLIQIGGKYWWNGYWQVVLGEKARDPYKSYGGDIYFHPHHDGVPSSLFERVPQPKTMYSPSGGHIEEAEKWLNAYLLVRVPSKPASDDAIAAAYRECGEMKHSKRFTHPHIMDRQNVKVVDNAEDETLCICKLCSPPPPAPTSTDT